MKSDISIYLYMLYTCVKFSLCRGRKDVEQYRGLANRDVPLQNTLLSLPLFDPIPRHLVGPERCGNGNRS